VIGNDSDPCLEIHSDVLQLKVGLGCSFTFDTISDSRAMIMRHLLDMKQIYFPTVTVDIITAIDKGSAST